MFSRLREDIRSVFARDPAKLKSELKAQREAGIAVVREALAD